jgi:D-xylose transport system substrate-binding protein
MVIDTRPLGKGTRATRRARSSALASLLTVALCAAASACAGSGSSPARALSTLPATSAESAAPTVVGAHGRVGVVLADETSPAAIRPTSTTRTTVRAVLTKAGFETSVEVAADAPAFVAAATRMIAEPVSVLVLSTSASDAATKVRTMAAAARITTIDYERLAPGSGATLFVGTDERALGDALARSVLACIADKKVSHAHVVELRDGPLDPPSLARQGYLAIMQPRYDAGDNVKAAERTVQPADSATAGAIFADVLTAAAGRVDAVVADGDQLAVGAIETMKRNGLQLSVVGAGITVTALRNVLRGEQCAAVGTTPKATADVLAHIVVAVLAGDRAAMPGVVHDAVGNADVAAALVAPVTVGRADVRAAVLGGAATVAELCADLTSRCSAANIT